MFSHFACILIYDLYCQTRLRKKISVHVFQINLIVNSIILFNVNENKAVIDRRTVLFESDLQVLSTYFC